MDKMQYKTNRNPRDGPNGVYRGPVKWPFTIKATSINHDPKEKTHLFPEFVLAMSSIQLCDPSPPLLIVRSKLKKDPSHPYVVF